MRHFKTTTNSYFIRIYCALSPLLTFAWKWVLQRRLRTGKETETSINQRLMLQPATRSNGIVVWGHAVGVGESLALLGLMQRISKARPDIHFLITTTARTSQQALSKQQLGNQFTHQFMPIDTPETAAKFIAYWQPSVAIWCEMDLWPALVNTTYQSGIPMLLVNARINQKSLAKKRKARFFYRPLLHMFSTFWAQNHLSSEALVSLGADAEKIQETGTIKSFAEAPAANPEQLILWQALTDKRPIWLLASSHEPEESLALESHQIICQKHPDALLIIAPRLPKRSGEIEKLCAKQFDQSLILKRTVSDALPIRETIYIADTMGELGLWYRVCKIAMVGGSWAEIGGHNPFEATSCGCAVIHGEHVDNFSESYQSLNDSGDATQCANVQAIADQVLKTWNNKPLSIEKKQTHFDKPEIQNAYQALMQSIPFEDNK